jgi:hypothetical protein
MSIVAVDETTRKYLREREKRKAAAEGKTVAAPEANIEYVRPSTHRRDFTYGGALLVKDPQKVLTAERDFLRILEEELSETVRTGIAEVLPEPPGPHVRRRTLLSHFPLVGVVGKVKEPVFRAACRNLVIGALEDIHKSQFNGSWRLESYEVEVVDDRIVVLGVYVDIRGEEDIKYQDGKYMLADEVKKSADYMAESIAASIAKAVSGKTTEAEPVADSTEAEPVKRGPGRPPKH